MFRSQPCLPYLNDVGRLTVKAKKENRWELKHQLLLLVQIVVNRPYLIGSVLVVGIIRERK